MKGLNNAEMEIIMKSSLSILVTHLTLFLDETKVCQLISRPILERTYGIIIPPPGEAEDPARPPTAYELLNSYGGRYLPVLCMYFHAYLTYNYCHFNIKRN